MSVSDTAASTSKTQQMSQPDTQHLIALLSNLMPLLARIQQQTLQPVFVLGADAQLGSSGFVLSNPALDHQAAVSLVEDITANSLRTLSAYLESNASQHAELQNCVAIVAQAARCFSIPDYAQAFGLIWEAYRVITMARAANPHLAPLRTTGRASSVGSPPPTTPSATQIH